MTRKVISDCQINLRGGLDGETGTIEMFGILHAYHNSGKGKFKLSCTVLSSRAAFAFLAELKQQLTLVLTCAQLNCMYPELLH